MLAKFFFIKLYQKISKSQFSTILHQSIDKRTDPLAYCVLSLTLSVTLCKFLGSPGYGRHIVTYSFMSSLFCHPDTRPQLRDHIFLQTLEKKRRKSIYIANKRTNISIILQQNIVYIFTRFFRVIFFVEQRSLNG